MQAAIKDMKLSDPNIKNHQFKDCFFILCCIWCCSCKIQVVQYLVWPRAVVWHGCTACLRELPWLHVLGKVWQLLLLKHLAPPCNCHRSEIGKFLSCIYRTGQAHNQKHREGGKGGGRFWGSEGRCSVAGRTFFF